MPQWMSEKRAAIHKIENKGGERRSKIAVQRRHGAGLDRSFKTRAHHEFGAGAKGLDERPQLAEIVRAVGVAHNDEGATDEWHGVDVSAPEAALRRFEDTGAGCQRDLGGPVGRGIDNQNFDARPTRGDSLLTPGDKLPNRHLFIEGRHKYRKLRILHVG